MKKIHTKIKRKHNLSTNKRQYNFFHPPVIEHRPKTFASEALAKKWAGEQGLKEGSFTLKLVKHDKRYQIVLPAAVKAEKTVKKTTK